MKQSITICLVCVCLLLTTDKLLADDLNPPPWWRGNSIATCVLWEFDTNNPGPMGPDWGNRIGTTSELTVTPGEGMGWLSEDHPYSCEYEGRPVVVGDGVWQLTGAIDAIVDAGSWSIRNPVPGVDTWIQLTWRPQDLDECPIVYLLNLGVRMYPISEIQLGPDWRHSTYSISCAGPFAGKIADSIRITGNINVGELIVDMNCPEPASLALLALGGLALLRRARRK